jgi:hypothetical protein
LFQKYNCKHYAKGGDDDDDDDDDNNNNNYPWRNGTKGVFLKTSRK